jgi:flagellar hook-associated protein 2
VQLFVDQYNKLRDKLESLTFFHEEDQTKGLLFGSSEALRLDSDLSRFVTGGFTGVGDVQNLAQIGVTIGQDGKLTFDKSKLETLYAANPEGVKKFFSDDKLGFGAKADAMIETLVGRDNSVLVNRSATLDRQVQDLGKRIDALNARLDRRRERLTKEFYNMELAINKIKSNLSAIGQIQNLFSTSNNNNR